MRLRSIIIDIILITVIAAAFTTLFCAAFSSCSVNETDRAAPNLIAHDRHTKEAATRPALAPLVSIEDAAVNEYYNSIDSGDQTRFLAAKRALAQAVAATEKAEGGK